MDRLLTRERTRTTASNAFPRLIPSAAVLRKTSRRTRIAVLRAPEHFVNLQVTPLNRHTVLHSFLTRRRRSQNTAKAGKNRIRSLLRASLLTCLLSSFAISIPVSTRPANPDCAIQHQRPPSNDSCNCQSNCATLSGWNRHAVTLRTPRREYQARPDPLLQSHVRAWCENATQRRTQQR